MDFGILITLFEFGAVFGLFILVCWWQLRSLDKLEARDQAEERSKARQEEVEVEK